MSRAYSFSVNNDTIEIGLRLQIIAKNDPARCCQVIIFVLNGCILLISLNTESIIFLMLSIKNIDNDELKINN